MKRDFLKAMGLTDEQIDQIMAEAGKDVETQKKAVSTLESERDQIKAQVEGLNTQLTDAGKQIEAFKGMDVEGVKKAAADWQAKADHALEGALTGAKAKNAKAVRALLDQAAMKLNDDGSILGLKEQLEKVQSENAYLFDGDVTDPKIVDKTTTTSTISDPLIASAFLGAGIKQK
jgi:hypothetical protein